MRLSHPLLSTPLHQIEGRIPVLVAENPIVFRKLLTELSAQAEGRLGSFILSKDYEPLDCAEHLQVLTNYLSLHLNNRRLQNRFQTLLTSLLAEELSEAHNKLQQEIVNFLHRLSISINYPLSFNHEEYVPTLLKAIKLQPDLEENDALVSLMQYLEIQHDLLKQQCFILVNLHGYFSSEEISELYRYAHYKKWSLFVLEYHLKNSLPDEEVSIIDSQLCELRSDKDDF